MATPADQRLLELLDKWLKSLELHLKYSSLDDDSYWKVQPWVEHQRPNRWILDLARQKTLALKTQVEQRIEAGDGQFADSLELMIFLANLVGSEHIERFIPVADPQNERPLRPAAPTETEADDPDSVTGTNEMPQLTETSGTREMPRPGEATATREMPRFEAPAHTPAPVATPLVARNERRQAEAPRPTAKGGTRSRGKTPAPAAEEDPEITRELVIADAARLVQWGRRWFELPELIARMADRPSLAEVRRILKENKNTIERKAGLP